MYPQVTELQRHRLVRVEQQEQAEGRYRHIPQHRGQGRAEHPQAQDLDKYTGEDDVQHHRRHRQKHRRQGVPSGLPDGLEGEKQEGEHQLKGAGAHIGHRALQYSPFRPHEAHDPRGNQVEQQVEPHPEQEGNHCQHTGVFLGPFLPSGPQELAHRRHTGHAKAHLEGGKNIQQGPGQRHPRLRGYRVCHLADKIGIHQLVEGLHKVGPEHRQGQNQKGFVQIGLPEQQLRPVALHRASAPWSNIGQYMMFLTPLVSILF